MKSKIILFVAFALLFGCVGTDTNTPKDAEDGTNGVNSDDVGSDDISNDNVNTDKVADGTSELKLTSSAFQHGGTIPKKYTCDGEDVNPQLSISGVPSNAKSLAIIMDDPDANYPDAQDGAWVHWVVWNIPSETTEIPEGQGENVGVQGMNSGESGYNGPCPPAKHTYRFFLYALDTTLDLPAGATKEDLKSAMNGYIIAQTELDGEYETK